MMSFFTLFTLFSIGIASPHQDIIQPPQARQVSKTTGYTPDVTVYGYLPYWSTDVEDVDFSGLSHIAYFSVGLEASGSLSRTGDWANVAPTLVSRAHAAGVSVHLCMTSFSDDVNNVVLPSASKRTQAISELVNLIEAYDADGINIDIEGMDASQRQNLNAFIAELSQEVPEIVIATPAVDWSNAYDYSTLSQYASLFIMGYDYHWSSSDPGPIDPLYGGSPWAQWSLELSVQDHLALAPADRIILGLPLYGRSWPTADTSVPGVATATGTTILMGEAEDIAAIDGWEYDQVTHSPYLLYPNEQIWSQNVESVRERVQFGLDQNLQGVGFWALGYENGVDGFWTMMQQETDFDTDETENDDDPENEDPENNPPVADAGLDKTVNQGDIVQLDGSYSYDPDQDPISFQWTILDPSVVLDSETSAQPSFTATTSGTIFIDLTVSDGQSQSADSVTITVLGSNGKNVEEEGKPQSCQTSPQSSFYALLFVLLCPFAFFPRYR